jgi:hypothetical protein
VLLGVGSTTHHQRFQDTQQPFRQRDATEAADVTIGYVVATCAHSRLCALLMYGHVVNPTKCSAHAAYCSPVFCIIDGIGCASCAHLYVSQNRPNVKSVMQCVLGFSICRVF